ncbi:hypothetical protein l11_17750 [Neisseria weaveri LMG 5135]|nr:hypothetical protein l11_17750 [Neisseria weaveri LMG 5135]EGV38543.1 hypothetical protein l13_00760 [Neisseria weaveri ATCC 51223]
MFDIKCFTNGLLTHGLFQFAGLDTADFMIMRKNTAVRFDK